MYARGNGERHAKERSSYQEVRICTIGFSSLSGILYKIEVPSKFKLSHSSSKVQVLLSPQISIHVLMALR